MEITIIITGLICLFIGFFIGFYFSPNLMKDAFKGIFAETAKGVLDDVTKQQQELERAKTHQP